MFVNTCTKCGQGFETKNPNRVVCPNCLYPDRSRVDAPAASPYQRPPQAVGGYASPQGQPGAYGPPRPYNQAQPGFGPPRPPMGQPGGYGPPRPGGFNGPPRPGGFGGPRPGGRPGFGGPRPGGRPGFGGPRRPAGPPKKLLIPKEILAQIEEMYKPLLPLPNPDTHEIIAQKLSIEPSKAFFGMNLVRMKLKLPKLDYPKRKLAVSPDQLMAIETMYTPYMTMETPPIGIHKIIAKQLKLDEWRVHVAIGLIRKAKNMPRWNTEREDLPAQMKAHLVSQAAATPPTLDAAPAIAAVATVEEAPSVKATKPKTKKVAVVDSDDVEIVVATAEAVSESPPVVVAADETAEEAPKKRGRPKKTSA